MTTRPPTAADRPIALLAAWAATLAMAMAATWRLWTPWRETPRLAPLEFLEGAPAQLDFALLAMLGYGLFRALIYQTGWRRGVGIATAALVGLMAVDQLRWQPWAYHAAIAGVILASASAGQAYRLLRFVAIAVYAYSAIAKLDAEFAATLGQQMLGVVGRPIGIDPSGLSVTTRNALALALPVGELLIAGLLGASLRWRRLCPAACIAVALMHAATIGLLGPWALGHSLGVLFWNVGFACQTVVLFRPFGEPVNRPANGRPLAALTACGLAVIAPALTPWGYWDQWPGWALYAPGGERATLFVHTASIDRLPQSIQQHVDSPGDSPWRRVRVDDWALAASGAPVYPQNRIVAAMATALAERHALSGRVRVVAESAAGRLSRERRAEALDSDAEIRAASELIGLRPGVRWTE